MPLGILAGWSNENSGAALLIFLLLYGVRKWHKKESWALFEILGVAGFFIGFALLIGAPGNYVRGEVSPKVGQLYFQYPDSFVLGAMLQFIKINTILTYSETLLIALACLLYETKVQKDSFFRIDQAALFFVLAFLISAYSMVLSPAFPGRARMIVVILLIITLLLLGESITFSEKIKNGYALLFFISTLVVFPVSFMKASSEILRIHTQSQQRLAHIHQQKSLGNLDIVVRSPITTIDKHAPLHGLEDIYPDPKAWTNLAIARYFGLHSLTGDGKGW